MRGGRRPGAGRPKGSVSKVTADTREAFRKLIEGEHENLKAALDEVRFGIEIEKQTDQGTVVGRLNADPKGYLDIIAKLAKFCLPELARQEITGAEGGPVVVEIRKFSEAE